MFLNNVKLHGIKTSSSINRKKKKLWNNEKLHGVKTLGAK